jgi:hypothetical protein
MRAHLSTSYVALLALAGAFACGGNTARTDDGTSPDEAAAATDTTTGQDTLGGQNENPPGYRGMERDTSITPTQTPTDSFLQNQGQGTPQDTAGYSGMERVDTTGQQGQNQTDTTGYNANPGAAGQDTSGMGGMQHGDTAGGAQLDSTGMSQTGDTTGYQESQEQKDTTNSQ